MNTKQLQKNFSHVYEQFYAQHKLIYTAPFVFSWVGETTVKSSGVSIKQKLSLKMHLAIDIQEEQSVPIRGAYCPLPTDIHKQIGGPSISRGDITVFDLQTKQFVTVPLREYLPYIDHIDIAIEQYITKMMPRNTAQKEYRISLLSEMPHTTGLGFDSVFSLLVATALEKIAGKLPSQGADNTIFLPEEDVSGKKGQASMTKTESINDEKREEYHVLRLAHAIESSLVGEHYLDGAVATAMIPGGGPIVSFHEDIYTDTKSSRQNRLFLVHDYKYFALSLQKLYPTSIFNSMLPIDFGLLYTGRPLIVENKHSLKGENRFHIQTLHDTFKPYVQTTSGNRKPKFFTDVLAKHTKSGDSIYDTMLGSLTLEMVELLRIISTRGYGESDMQNVVQMITKIRHVHNIGKKPSTHLVRFIDALYQQVAFRTDYIGVCYNDVHTMGGSLLFATPTEGVRSDIAQILFALQRTVPSAELLYTSWKDGYQEEGLICEQDIATQKSSQFINSNLLMMQVVNGPGDTHFGTYEQLVGHEDVDIVLDTINMKIYAYGEKLTSKELHSQSGTIEMLLLALQHVGVDISNKQFPLSSYSKSKNDMVGKIVSPLIKIVRDRINKDLPIECYGGMYEYYLKLKKNNVRFGVVKRVVEV